MTSWFRITFAWRLGHFIPCLHENWMQTKAILDWQKLRMRYPFQSTCKPISHRNEWSFRVYMIPLRNLVPEWNSRPGARTGVNSRRGDSRWNDILWWYHVNKCRALRGNRSELAPARKSPRCHVNNPFKLNLTKPHTDYLKRGLGHTGALLWNSLPESIRAIRSIG